jgi:hypothetical protein
MLKQKGMLIPALVACTGLALAPGRTIAQATEQPQGGPGQLPGVKTGQSSNVHLVGHIALGGYFRVTNDEIEQDPGRPWAYIAQGRERTGFSIIDLRVENHPKVLYNWRIENVDLHRPMIGGQDGKYFKLHGRYYYLLAVQFQPGTLDEDLGAVIVDVTGLPDTSTIKVVARVTAPEPGGFHNTFVYRHSDGRTLLFTTVQHKWANVYDLSKLLAGAPNFGKIAQVPIPAYVTPVPDLPAQAAGDTTKVTTSGITLFPRSYHDFYVGYDPATHQDKFYGAGQGGYYVFDISNIGKDEPKLLTSIVGASGVVSGHTFTPTPDGKFAVTETEYQYAPLRIFDLQPGLEGKVQAITNPVGAWTPDWHDLAHNHEVRWPYVFVSAYEDGLQIFNMVDPANLVTIGWYYTCMCQHQRGFVGPPAWAGPTIFQGAFGVDVRNYDGLIILSDSNTGVWLFRLDGFDGWNGHDWGMPNISSVQDYDHGPDGAGAAHVTATR